MGTVVGVPALETVFLNIPFAKVDAEQRMVYGEATSEVVDKANELMDYAAAKKAFQTWPGNIREMHQPKAVGKAVDITFQDDAKRVLVKARISEGAEDTWKKVLDGTLGFYSVKGLGLRTIEKMGDKTIARIRMDQLIELSLVDNPGLQTTKIEVVKMVDGHSVDTGVVDPQPTLILKAIETYDVQCALQVLNLLQQLTASELMDASGMGYNGDAPEQVDLDQVNMLRAAAVLVFQFLTSEYGEQFTDLDRQQAVVQASADKILTHRDTGRTREQIRAALHQAIEKSLMEVPVFWQALDTDGRLYFSKDVRGKTHKTFVQKMHDMTAKLGASCKGVTDPNQRFEDPDAADDGKPGAGGGPKAGGDRTNLGLDKGVQGDTTMADATVEKGIQGGQGNPNPGGLAGTGSGGTGGAAGASSITPGAQTQNPGAPAALVKEAPTQSIDTGGAAARTGGADPGSGQTGPAGSGAAPGGDATMAAPGPQTLGSTSTASNSGPAGTASTGSAGVKKDVDGEHPPATLETILKALDDLKDQLKETRAQNAGLQEQVEKLSKQPVPGPRTRAVSASNVVAVAKSLGTSSPQAEATADDVKVSLEGLEAIVKAIPAGQEGDAARQRAAEVMLIIQQKSGMGGILMTTRGREGQTTT
jgi:hypothetical protein